jgi:uncharacterized protein YjbJ (UPF0337 family)
MDKEHVKGAADKAKGVMKEAAGKAMGDKGLEVEGKLDKLKGAARQALGDIGDAGNYNAVGGRRCRDADPGKVRWPDWWEVGR